MLKTIALRFRDHRTDVDTIEEHTSIIEQKKYAWWGWWKKDSEPNQHNVINELGERARNGPIQIGLFDRSTDRFFFAIASDFILNQRSRGTPEPDRTPRYYSNDKRVEAWIKLHAIEKVPSNLFKEQFGETPTSEHTLFPISTEATPQQSENGHFLKLRSANVLHISDVHFGGDHGFPLRKEVGREPVIEKLKRDLDNLCGNEIGLIVVSGDIGSKGDANALLIEGLNFLNALHSELKVPKEAILVIPGNHDFRLSEYQPTDFSHERPFNTMLKEFYGSFDPDERLKRFQFPSGHHAEFLLINSVRLRKTSESNYGYVEWSLYDNRLKKISKEKDVTRVAILHHHLISMPREELLDKDYPHAGISTTIDSGAVIEGLQAHGFRLALHGHQHIPGIARISRGIINSKNEASPPNDLAILSAGSAGAKADRLSNSMRDNSYNFLRFEKDDILVEARRYNVGLDGQRYFQGRITR
jgi:hypothetical protein